MESLALSLSFPRDMRRTPLLKGPLCLCHSRGKRRTFLWKYTVGRKGHKMRTNVILALIRAPAIIHDRICFFGSERRGLRSPFSAHHPHFTRFVCDSAPLLRSRVEAAAMKYGSPAPPIPIGVGSARGLFAVWAREGVGRTHLLLPRAKPIKTIDYLPYTICNYKPFP